MSLKAIDSSTVCVAAIIISALIRMILFRNRPDRFFTPISQWEKVIGISALAGLSLMLVLAFNNVIPLKGAKQIADVMVVLFTLRTVIRFLT